MKECQRQMSGTQPGPEPSALAHVSFPPPPHFQLPTVPPTSTLLTLHSFPCYPGASKRDIEGLVEVTRWVKALAREACGPDLSNHAEARGINQLLKDVF